MCTCLRRHIRPSFPPLQLLYSIERRTSVLFQTFIKEKSLYSPKIREDLIPRIDRAAKEAKLPMTTWVNRVLERCLPETAEQQQTLKERKVSYEYRRN